jgi:hypothetical protein
MAVSGVERVAELTVMPANPGQAALQRGDACRLRAVSSAIGAGGEIEPDRLGIGRQLRQTLPAKPGRKMSPVGVVGALRVAGAGGASVVFGRLGEGGERIAARNVGRCRARLLSGLEIPGFPRSASCFMTGLAVKKRTLLRSLTGLTFRADDGAPGRSSR